MSHGIERINSNYSTSTHTHRYIHEARIILLPRKTFLLSFDTTLLREAPVIYASPQITGCSHSFACTLIRSRRRFYFSIMILERVNVLELHE
jgi:hypothetical protein